MKYRVPESGGFRAFIESVWGRACVLVAALNLLWIGLTLSNYWGEVDEEGYIVFFGLFGAALPTIFLVGHIFLTRNAQIIWWWFLLIFALTTALTCGFVLDQYGDSDYAILAFAPFATVAYFLFISKFDKKVSVPKVSRRSLGGKKVEKKPVNFRHIALILIHDAFLIACAFVVAVLISTIIASMSPGCVTCGANVAVTFLFAAVLSLQPIIWCEGTRQNLISNWTRALFLGGVAYLSLEFAAASLFFESEHIALGLTLGGLANTAFTFVALGVSTLLVFIKRKTHVATEEGSVQASP